MIRPLDRKIATVLVCIRIFTVRKLWWTYQIYARKGARWIFNWMLRRQTLDGLHHAPACPGNEWSGANLVFNLCNCGALEEKENGY